MLHVKKDVNWRGDHNTFTGWWKRVEGKGILQRGLEEASENNKESMRAAHVNGMNECQQTSASYPKSALKYSSSTKLTWGHYKLEFFNYRK
jgi:hypothetical protein